MGVLFSIWEANFSLSCEHFLKNSCFAVSSSFFWTPFSKTVTICVFSQFFSKKVLNAFVSGRIEKAEMNYLKCLGSTRIVIILEIVW
jgi:hypothetical protein